MTTIHELSHLKTWALGIYHGRRQHLQSDLEEVVFRFNRRQTRQATFRTVLGIGVAITPETYKMFITSDTQGGTGHPALQIAEPGRRWRG